MDKTDRLRDYGLAFLLYEQGLGLCGYELIRELFIFVKLILNSYLEGKHEANTETAQRLLAMGLSAEQVVKATQLSLEIIKNLSNS